MAAQGVVISAGGSVAFYPTEVSSHSLAANLQSPDLYGELKATATRLGLVVVAGIDGGFLDEKQSEARPEWAAMDDTAKPIRLGGRVAACINGGYYSDFMPSVIREIVQRSAPSGILARGWSGVGRSYICHCAICEQRFREATQLSLPVSVDWDDLAYRAWIRWSYDLRIKLWASNQHLATRVSAGSCRWIGLISVSRSERARSLQDLRAICELTPILFAETTFPLRKGRFRDTIAEGDYLGNILRAKTVVLSTPLHFLGQQRFALSATAPAECRLNVLAAISGRMSPGLEEAEDSSADQRGTATARAIFEWHRVSQPYLIHRTAVARVGLVWSQESADLYGRSQAELLAYMPYAGMVHALSKINASFKCIDIEDLEHELSTLEVLILPNVAAMSEASIKVVRDFVSAGGVLLASGETSLYDQDGEVKGDFGLADVFGVHLTDAAPDRMAAISRITPPSIFEPGGSMVGRLKGPATDHSYLRFSPEFAGRSAGPHKAGERHEPGSRHDILSGFDQTDIVAFGGILFPLRVDPKRTVLLTYVPPFPSSPIDKVYMTVERTSVPGLVVGDYGRGRVAFMPADLDRRFGIDPITDHGAILGNLLRWAMIDQPQVVIDGAGVVCSTLYRQNTKLILQLINLTGADNQAHPVARLIPVGPLKIRVLSPGRSAPVVKAVDPAGQLAVVPQARTSTHVVEFEVRRIVDSAMYVLE